MLKVEVFGTLNPFLRLFRLNISTRALQVGKGEVYAEFFSTVQFIFGIILSPTTLFQAQQRAVFKQDQIRRDTNLMKMRTVDHLIHF